ncbi:MAG: DUF3120 domain-containing protein [Nodosilinea sp.]
MSLTYNPAIAKSVSLGLNLVNTWARCSSLQIQVLLAALALVTLPVFVQAPLVRYFPWVTLGLTLAWLGLGTYLANRQGAEIWGDLLIGFGWIWLTGSIYWGWFRWEPVAHLPIEALGLPIALGCLYLGVGRVGSYFFLGSLLGTAITDLYINWMGLFPAWRQLMVADTELAPVILQATAAGLQTDVAAGRAVVLATFLLVATIISLATSRQLAWWAFGGALLSTLVVDGLFFIGAILA